MNRLVRMMALVMVCALLCGACASGEALRGYTKKDGYVYVTLGRYPQSIDGGVPEQNRNTWTWSRHPIKDAESVNISTDPILWRVLTVDDGRAYLLSEYVLFAMPMHVNYNEYKTIGADFGNTDLCRYLNTTFAETAFTDAEMDMLLPCETYGRVFLPDSEDVKSTALGMGTGQGLKGWGTEYAIRVTGLYVFSTRYGAHSAYWVRNQSTTDKRHARCTKDGGQLGHIISDRDNEGARPAVYLSMDSFAIEGGEGTKTDPYRLVPAGVK